MGSYTERQNNRETVSHLFICVVLRDQHQWDHTQTDSETARQPVIILLVWYCVTNMKEIIRKETVKTASQPVTILSVWYCVTSINGIVHRETEKQRDSQSPFYLCGTA